MLGAGGFGAAAASVSLSGVKNCFLHLPPGLVSYLRLQQVQEFRKVATNLHSGIAPLFHGAPYSFYAP